MAINFDSLPTDKPMSTIPKGTYIATIEDAQMKQGQDLQKPPYLNLKYSLKNEKGESVGILFDSLFESEHSLMQYKLKRFLTATQIPMTGVFELKDLAKVVKGKQIILDTLVEEKDGRPAKAVVDLFSGEVYYPMSEAVNIFGTAPANTSAAGEINEADAETADANDEDLDF